MTAARRLLHALFAFAAGAPLSAFKPGIYRDAWGKVLVHALQAPPASERTERRARLLARRLLAIAARDIEMLEARVNALGVPAEMSSALRRRSSPLVRAHAAPGRLCPTIRVASDWPVAILVAALLTPVGRSDVLANRIARCERCGRYHLLPTGRPSRFCSRPCRRRAAA